jgi:large subunit ribosomal protein L19
MNNQLLEKIEKSHMKKVPELRAGDTVRVHQKIKEGKKERVQVFEGVVLRVKGGGLRQSFLVRKISFGIGVEKNFLIHAPNIVKIEVKKRAKVRQAYLTYLRKLTGKSARLKDKQFDSLVVNVKESADEAQDEVKASEDLKADAEVTELEKVAVADVEAEVPLSEVEKSENKEAAKDAGDEPVTGEDEGQEAEIAEIEEGLEKADMDAEKGKNKKEILSEETAEDLTPEEVTEEIKEEKEN